jgi:Membrane carboxypeptidase (penicillin-binding protein)
MARNTTSARPRRNQPRPDHSNRNIKFSGLLRRALRLAGWVMLGLMLLILLLRFVPPPTSAFMLVRHVERLFDTPPGPTIMYSWTPMDAIPAHMALAVVAAEDQNFPRHFGFDLDAIARAMEHNEKQHTVRGASTISQQVAKNLFLWSGRSYVRKGLEAGDRADRDTLVQEENFGSVSQYCRIRGRDLRSWSGGQAFLRQDAGQADPAGGRASGLGLPSPRRLSAQRPSPYLWQRANWVQTQMRQLGTSYVDLR